MDNVYLMGSEDVLRAGNVIGSSAQAMERAASSIEDSLQRHRAFLDEWLQRFEAALATPPASDGSGK